ncbi:hypothetical protein H5410_054372 [Solanum commersonii]|uniref:Uncharacterized protein n=1 Tax=Solanum commersonii TaxID=4109 RepID=A0A9J5WHC0_SOLCO|nr:hypothetical protein H5410_054372 [Solanum commersonii]
MYMKVLRYVGVVELQRYNKECITLRADRETENKTGDSACEQNNSTLGPRERFMKELGANLEFRVTLHTKGTCFLCLRKRFAKELVYAIIRSLIY